MRLGRWAKTTLYITLQTMSRVLIFILRTPGNYRRGDKLGLIDPSGYWVEIYFQIVEVQEKEDGGSNNTYSDDKIIIKITEVISDLQLSNWEIL